MYLFIPITNEKDLCTPMVHEKDLCTMLTFKNKGKTCNCPNHLLHIDFPLFRTSSLAKGRGLVGRVSAPGLLRAPGHPPTPNPGYDCLFLASMQVLLLRTGMGRP